MCCLVDPVLNIIYALNYAVTLLYKSNEYMPCYWYSIIVTNCFKLILIKFTNSIAHLLSNKQTCQQARENCCHSYKAAYRQMVTNVYNLLLFPGNFHGGSTVQTLDLSQKVSLVYIKFVICNKQAHYCHCSQVGPIKSDLKVY